MRLKLIFTPVSGQKSVFADWQAQWAYGKNTHSALVVELVDTRDLKSRSRKWVSVRVRSEAPKKNRHLWINLLKCLLSYSIPSLLLSRPCRAFLHTYSVSGNKIYSSRHLADEPFNVSSKKASSISASSFKRHEAGLPKYQDQDVMNGNIFQFCRSFSRWESISLGNRG